MKIKLITVAVAIFCLRWVAIAQAIDDSDHVVRLKRAEQDDAYAKLVDRHRCIKAYLNSPLKGTP